MRVGQRAPASTKTILAAELRLRETAERKAQVRDIWHRLNAVVDERGGSITTPPYRWPARLEVHPESELPAKLAALGYLVMSRGQITRVGPQILTHDLKGREKEKPALGISYGFHQRDAFDIDLGGR